MVHSSGDRVFIELRYLHAHLVETAGFKRRRNDWVRDNMRKLGSAGISDDHVTRASSLAGTISFDTCSALGFVTLLANTLNSGNSGSNHVFVCATQALRLIAHHCVQVVTGPAHQHHAPYRITVQYRALRATLIVDRLVGKVANWPAVASVIPGAVDLWQCCCQDRDYCGIVLSTGIEMPFFHEVVTFLACALRHIPYVGGGRDAIFAVLTCIAPHIAEVFQTCIIQAAVGTETAPRPPVIRLGPRSSIIDPNTACALLCRARELGTIPREVLRFNNDRAEYQGLRHHVADLWFLKELCMYMRNTQAAFAGVCQMSMAADPSVYNGEDTLVSQVYSATCKIAATACVKVIPRCKHIALDELAMTDRFAAVVIERRQQRWAAFKEVRAISSQISDVTQGSMVSDDHGHSIVTVGIRSFDRSL